MRFAFGILARTLRLSFLRFFGRCCSSLQGSIGFSHSLVQNSLRGCHGLFFGSANEHLNNHRVSDDEQESRKPFDLGFFNQLRVFAVVEKAEGSAELRCREANVSTAVGAGVPHRLNDLNCFEDILIDNTQCESQIDTIIKTPQQPAAAREILPLRLVERDEILHDPFEQQIFD